MSGDDVELDVEALSEFIAGCSIAEIASIYRWSFATAENQLRKAMIRYGFRRQVISASQRDRFVRVVRRIRRT